MIGKRPVLAGLFTCYVVVFAVLLRIPQHWWTPLLLTSVSIAIFVPLLILLRHYESRPDRLVLRTVVLGGGALQAVAVTGRPTTSDDVYRYIWDGKVQLHGIDPYRYAPRSAHLADLRDDVLFGPNSPCFHPIPGSCTAINRPSVHTIYPPGGQLAFDVVRLVSFGRAPVFAFEIAAALGCVLVALLLARQAHRRGWPPWRVAAWAWCPLVVIEFGNNAHLDWLAVVLVVLTLSHAARGHSGRAGALLGAAIMTKLYPVLLLPALLREHRARVVSSAVAVGVIAYLPHVLAVGSGVIGFLPGYLHEQGYDSGTRLQLLGAILPAPFDTVTGAVVLLAIGAWLIFRAPALPVETAAIAMVGPALLITTPRYSWYAGLLVALISMSGRWEWLPVVFAAMLAYVTRTTALPGAALYLAALILTTLLAVLRAAAPLRARSPVTAR